MFLLSETGIIIGFLLFQDVFHNEGDDSELSRFWQYHLFDSVDVNLSSGRAANRFSSAVGQVP